MQVGQIRLQCGCIVEVQDHHNMTLTRCALHVNNQMDTIIYQAKFHNDPNWKRAYKAWNN